MDARDARNTGVIRKLGLTKGSRLLSVKKKKKKKKNLIAKAVL